MAEDLFRDFAAFLTEGRPDSAGWDYLQRLGAEGCRRLLRQLEAEYCQATQSIELSGRDLARIAALAYLLAQAAGVTGADSKLAMAHLLEVGWVMASWYAGE
ncbi:MAG: hypothetical protein C4290_05165 [Chloroflexota bacterium]